MKTGVRLRGNLRPPGAPEIQVVEVDEGATVDDLIGLLGLRPGDIWLAMLDGQWVDSEHPLRPGDELSLIPPVGGGAQPSPGKKELDKPGTLCIISV